MSESFTFDEPSVFTVGTVGEPGHRVFYLQVMTGGDIVSVKCEKQQVEALADHLEGLLVDLPETGPVTPAESVPPTDLAWSTGMMAVAYDADDDRFVLLVQELVDEEAGEEPATLRARITRGQVRGLIDRGRELVAGGRPTCRFCGQPIDPAGHACPRMN